VIENWPMVGRANEVGSILARLRLGVGTVITGEAGVGKTTLAREVQRQLDLGGWRTQLVRCTARSGLPLSTLAPLQNGEPSVLFVDDAHVLDDESAELLWRLTGGRRCPNVARDCFRW
jgi:MoxR-like ATPase